MGPGLVVDAELDLVELDMSVLEIDLSDVTSVSVGVEDMELPVAVFVGAEELSRDVDIDIDEILKVFVLVERCVFVDSD